jgi:hypothetical protein
MFAKSLVVLGSVQKNKHHSLSSVDVLKGTRRLIALMALPPVPSAVVLIAILVKSISEEYLRRLYCPFGKQR